MSLSDLPPDGIYDEPATATESPTRRHDVVDSDTGEVVMTMLAFLGPRWVRVVCRAPLQRDGYTLRLEEAVGLRDALTAAIDELSGAGRG